MSGLQGKRIALACWRRATEIAKGVEKLGGLPLLRPTLRTLSVADDPDLQQHLTRLVREGADWFLFTTGMGVHALLEAADQLGLRADVLALLQQAHIAARGYKTAHALRELGLSIAARDRDGTTASLLSAFERMELKDAHVVVQAYGEPVPEITHWFHRRQARVTELLLYRHLPAPPEELHTLAEEIINARVDAVLFTSSPQVRRLWDFLHTHHLEEAVRAAFQNAVLAVAVGHVTAHALRERGITRILVPESERMGAALAALARFFDHP
ncbi:hypothetical protein HRbin08_00578 [bacterium HR08]|nr:hypothetical protein HRbin08_00578 [bacterium HR08]